MLLVENNSIQRGEYMVNVDIFLLGLMIVSALTGLVTEAVKKIFSENNITYRANTLAGIVSAVLSAAIGAGYVIYTGGGFTGQTIVCLIALVFLGWLCAMVGYDKIIGTFKTIDKG